MSDLSEGAMEDAELEGCEVNFLRVRAVERWLRTEAPDCWDIVRSRGAVEAAVVVPISSSQNGRRPKSRLVDVAATAADDADCAFVATRSCHFYAEDLVMSVIEKWKLEGSVVAVIGIHSRLRSCYE